MIVPDHYHLTTIKLRINLHIFDVKHNFQIKPNSKIKHNICISIGLLIKKTLTLGVC